MKAIILCGGEGTRLRPYTYTVPKPMLPLGGKPLLEYMIGHLKESGITEIILSVGYLKEKIMDYFGDGKKFGVKIEYFTENEPLSTAGSIYPHRKNLKERFIVMMGDHVTSINIKKLLETHEKSKALATIAVKIHKTPIEYGVIGADRSGKVVEFREKPVVEHLINSGIYVLEPEALNFIKPKEDFAKNVFPRMLQEGKKLQVHNFAELWLDIGRVSDYERARALFCEGGLKRLELYSRE